ncbi:13E12 repeat family protein, partial [Burkholderia cenocepacia]
MLAALGHLAIERAGSSNIERIAMSMRAVAAEVGVQARVSDRTVEARIAEAMTLVDTWPALVEAFAVGRIGRGHVRVITDAGAPLTSSDVPTEQRAAYEADMVALAETTSPGRVARAAKRAADAHLTEPLTVRHRAAREERRVRVTEVEDG